MTCFILPHHAKKEALHKMLLTFKERVESAPYTTHLPNMFNALQKRDSVHHYMIYWPLSKERFNTKRCLVEQSVMPECEAFHIIQVTSLLSKLSLKKNQFRRCDCSNHAREVTLDWREFIYPQFVEFLFNRSLTPTKCPSPQDKDTVQLTNETLQCCFEIAPILSLSDQLHHLPCSTIMQNYKNEHLTVFGCENREGEKHFKRIRVTQETHKLQFVVSQSKLYATEIRGGAKVMLKKTAEPYVIVARHFQLVTSKKNGATHYNIYLSAPCLNHSDLAWETKPKIKSERFGAKDKFCMIVSTSPLTLEFEDNGSFLLYSPGECGLTFQQECCLEMWNKEPGTYGWPLRYEINDDFLKRNYIGNEATLYQAIHGRYHRLFNESLQNHFDMIPPAYGYITKRPMKDVVLQTNGHVSHCDIYVEKETLLNQYGSFDTPAQSLSLNYNALKQIRAYMKNDVAHFYEGGEPLCVEEIAYTVSHVSYQLRALRRKAESVPLCYFYMNREKTYLLLIAVY